MAGCVPRETKLGHAMEQRPDCQPIGRGAGGNPPNRFARFRVEPDFDQLEPEDMVQAPRGHRAPEYLLDDARTIVTENDSPDVPFRYSLNPYRGCSHGCSYCYARPTHEYLGFSAGLDFETKILVKERAAALFRQFLARPGRQAEPVALSGVTDPYQPAERKFQLTRQCLEVALQARQPVSIITKNALVVRDLDLLRPMAQLGLVHVSLSITSLKPSLIRVMEPRTSPPKARLRAMRQLAEAGVPVCAVVAPVIPGLNDSEIPALLAACAEAGVRSAAYQLLRLPLSVKPVFLDWLSRTHPLQQKRIEAMIRSTRDGDWNCAAFGLRMTGTGTLAKQIRQLFHAFARKHRLDRTLPELDGSQFRAPLLNDRQMRLF